MRRLARDLRVRQLRLRSGWRARGTALKPSSKGSSMPSAHPPSRLPRKHLRLSPQRFRGARWSSKPPARRTKTSSRARPTVTSRVSAAWRRGSRPRGACWRRAPRPERQRWRRPTRRRPRRPLRSCPRWFRATARRWRQCRRRQRRMVRGHRSCWMTRGLRSSPSSLPSRGKPHSKSPPRRHPVPPASPPPRVRGTPKSRI
mmetsp:Transcript_27822/g.67850  ORF Transcript_27822/g.67850 Transcript_27822/m.67850 type:complete len:201 (-) Transcript_27822:2948-3550(-)